MLKVRVLPDRAQTARFICLSVHHGIGSRASTVQDEIERLYSHVGHTTLAGTWAGCLFKYFISLLTAPKGESKLNNCGYSVS